MGTAGFRQTASAAAGCVIAIATLAGCQRAAVQRSGPAATTDTATPAAAASGPVTFNKDVAPILFEHCAACHRPIESAEEARARAGADNPADPLCVAGAPFSVLDYASVRTRARAIARAVKSRAMPPWLPEPGHGEFLNERRLRDDQIAVIERWADEDAPEGDPQDRPRPPAWAGGWQLGTPDLVLKLPQPYELRPGDRDVFRNFVLPVPRAATRYVRAVEFRADNPAVLHHANIAIDPARVSRRLDRAEAGPGFATMPEDEVQNVFGWSPGKVPVLEPADTAWALEDGTDLVVQLHMVSGTKAETVQPTIGLFFSNTPPSRAPIVVKLESKSIDIPAGDANYVVEDNYVLPVDVDAVSVYPHAHYLAGEMRGTATLPDGTTKPLIWIRRWDVRWQDQYRYRTPLFLPKGTMLQMRFTYDNSAANPNNRNKPPRRVTWGAQSTDEMGALWLEVVPRRSEDASVLTADYVRRALNADIAAAELQLRAKPSDPALHNRLALKYVEAGRAQDALTHLQEALRIRPDDAEAHSNLGTVLQLQGKVAAAIPHLREGARLSPNDDRMHFNLGNGLYAAGQVDDAIGELRRAIAINGENADAHFNLAMLLGPRNRIDEAIAHLQRVIEINPRNPDAYRNLAVAYGLQGKIDQAIEQARAAVRIQPDSAPARQYLDQLLAARR